MTDKTCDERRNLSVSRSCDHVPLSVLIGLAILMGIVAGVSSRDVCEVRGNGRDQMLSSQVVE
jgi:hypothetical protein